MNTEAVLRGTEVLVTFVMLCLNLSQTELSKSGLMGWAASSSRVKFFVFLFVQE